jgi:hypothetical protein
MAQQQNSEDPTGVSSEQEAEGHTPTNVVRARERKANAAIQLKLAGATWEEVAQSLGYPTARTAIVATEKALEKQLADAGTRDQMRALAGARLERLIRAVWHKAIDPESPEQLQAVTKAKELVDRHAKLFGLDAPTEVVVHSPTTTELEAWVARIVSHQTAPVEEFDIIAGSVIPPAQEDEVALEWQDDDEDGDGGAVPARV